MKINGMELNQCKEQFSRAVAHAIATVAGLTTYRPDPDIESVDVGFGGVSELHPCRPRLEAQLKCTAQIKVTRTHIHYRLRKKNYDELRESFMVRRVLIVMRVPEDFRQWLEVSDEQTLIRHCCYWRSLEGLPITNEKSVTVKIPRKQQFTPAALQAIMKTIAEDFDERKRSRLEDQSA